MGFLLLRLALFKIKSEYDKSKVFGCRCYPCIRAYRTSKLGPKSVTCVLLGFLANQDGYLCFDPKLNKMYVSRDVQFYEDDFSLNLQRHEDYNAISPDKSTYFSVPTNLSIGTVDPDMDSPAHEILQPSVEFACMSADVSNSSVVSGPMGSAVHHVVSHDDGPMSENPDDSASPRSCGYSGGDFPFSAPTLSSDDPIKSPVVAESSPGSCRTALLRLR